jgi:hypothetical protein
MKSTRRGLELGVVPGVFGRAWGGMVCGLLLVGCGSSGGGSTGGAGTTGGGAGRGGAGAAAGTTGSGSAGASGAAGVTGAGGMTGAGGAVGTAGSAGSGSGGTGEGGHAGANGSGGTSGQAGQGGTAGKGGAGTTGTGAAGTAGVAGKGGGGTAGTAGAAGTTGKAGTSGSAGTTGAGGAGPVLAFPGAVGVGANATGGRGKAVYHVTNLNDSGTGSFRDAVGTSGRIIVFDVGGYINLSTPISAKSNLTIAGQTAPGDGVGVMGREVSFDAASNDIVREFRFRQGDLDADDTKSGINLLDATNMIFDHVSIEFAQWNNIDAVGASNITVMNSIDADPIGQQFNAHTETGPYTWYRNVFANAHNRNPLAKANTQYINNIIYDFQAGYTAGNTGGLFTHDLVNNYFITGPATTSASDAIYQVNTQEFYFSGNLLDSNKDGALNGSAMGAPSGTTALTAPWSPTTATIPTQTAAAAYASVVADAGASLHRDQVDTLVIADVTSLGKSGSLWTHQTNTGLTNSGYGTLAGGTAPTDTDGDGMPDAWETKYGLNPNSAADATGDFDHTGYTNVEKYVNGLIDGSYP